MKNKLFALLIIGFGLLLLTGCGSSDDKIVCTSSEEDFGITIDAEIVAKLKDKKVDSVSAEFVLDTEENAEALYSLLGGEDSGAKVEGTKVIVSDFSGMLNSLDEETTVIGMAKEDFIKLIEEKDYSCK